MNKFINTITSHRKTLITTLSCPFQAPQSKTWLIPEKNHVNFFGLVPPAAVKSLFGIRKQRLWFIWGLQLFYLVLKKDEHEVCKPLQWLESAWMWSPELPCCAANISLSLALSMRVILYAVLKTARGGVERGFQCEPSLSTSCFFWLISVKLSVLFCSLPVMTTGAASSLLSLAVPTAASRLSAALPTHPR